jgi:hypothetical protein
MTEAEQHERVWATISKTGKLVLRTSNRYAMAYVPYLRSHSRDTS